MRRYIRELRPTSVYDLAAMVALYRPGPMDNIPAYIRRKHGQEPVTYLHPLLEPYLEKTYGIFVYQEDIMASAIALGGFTGPEADTLGYAIRKKKSSVLRAQKEKFVTQAAERGVPPQTIDAVFKAFEPFERYGFNKAHATCYGLVAYQTAYLKANYTVEYMTAVLTAVRDTSERVAAAIAECRRLGIEVLPPDVHRSDVEFTVEGDAIRFGLLAVKNVGQGAIESIIAARAEGGAVPLADRPVLADRPAAGQPQGPRGAGPGRRAQRVRASRPRSCSGSTTPWPPAGPTQRDRLTGQTSLFELAAERGRPRRPAAAASPRRRPASACAGRRSCSGCTSPTIPWARSPRRSARSSPPTRATCRTSRSTSSGVVVGGIVTGVRMVITKARATMAIVSLEDLQGSIEVVVFPRLYEETRGTWTEGRILLVAGRVDHKGEEVSLLADLAVDWDDAVTRGPEAFAREVAAADRSRGRASPAHRAERQRQRQRQRPATPTGPAVRRSRRPPTANPGRPPVAAVRAPTRPARPDAGPSRSLRRSRPARRQRR